MARGGKRAGAGGPKRNFNISKERAKVLHDLARKYGVSEQQILDLAIDKLVPELFK